ncbi:AraC family transcriptional regulator [Dyadobacter fermentans]|uniref:Transcriptional regulator, AraC family n=1 Tax=Dyadobacter fermentans (strain ATCC 700827 / DSM 18053 / CIP 107007 / KCTC 52180 / NS114) TaxID=471854 RepID=C6VY23_DYAFD|nr:helix-turn-helix domain-containing protein [Dyadobacter fermentans]ACT96924.1 transcriptional regulator, AraC family [Dyadobacter fermentans DSM 18053]
MKPQLLQVPKGLQKSFSIRRDVVLYFYNRWHYHPELELIHIEQGSGTQFVGDNIRSFQSGDLLLIGPNLPHYWRCDEKYFQRGSQLYAQATVVHFSEEMLGKNFLSLPENKSIHDLLVKARLGLKILGEGTDKVKALLHDLLNQTNGNSIIGLLQILETLAHCEDINVLSNTQYQNEYDQYDTDRINQIYQYSISNFQKKISIEEIAEVANISPHSFCRYFKSRSRKTYSQFLLELRIGHACKLLSESRIPVAQVCFESGFHNFANFNKYFKLHTGKSPMQYQKEFRKIPISAHLPAFNTAV